MNCVNSKLVELKKMNSLEWIAHMQHVSNAEEGFEIAGQSPLYT